MPAPRSRRSGTSSRIGRAPELPPVDAEADIEVVEPPVDPEAEAAQVSAASASGRQSTKRSSRRPGSRSLEPARPLAPSEVEQQARRADLMLTVKLLLLVVVLAGAAVAVYMFGMQEPVKSKTANAALNTAQVKSVQIRKILLPPPNGNRDTVAAQTLLKEACAALNIPELEFAKDKPDEKAEKLASLEKALAANRLLKELNTEIKPSIERVERDLRAEDNYANVDGPLGRIVSLPDEQLVKLEIDFVKFLENPVDPEAGRNETYVTDYKDLVTSLRLKRIRLDQEKDRRRALVTDVPLRQAKQDAEALVKKEQFKDALAAIDELQRKFPDSKLDGVRTFVNQAAKLAWDSANVYAENNYKTFAGIGTDSQFAPEALKNAQRRMQEVIDRFGIEEYVAKGKEALARYQPK